MMAAIVFSAVMVVRLCRPRWEWIGEHRPTALTQFHFSRTQQTGVKLCAQRLRIQIDSHKSDRLAPVAIRFRPLFLQLIGDFSMMGIIVIVRSPPLSGRRVVALRSGDVKASYDAHSCREPEEPLGTKHTGKGSLDQVPKFLRVERLTGTIHKGSHAFVIMPNIWRAFHHLSPASASKCDLEV